MTIETPMEIGHGVPRKTSDRVAIVSGNNFFVSKPSRVPHVVEEQSIIPARLDNSFVSFLAQYNGISWNRCIDCEGASTLKSGKFACTPACNFNSPRVVYTAAAKATQTTRLFPVMQTEDKLHRFGGYSIS